MTKLANFNLTAHVFHRKNKPGSKLTYATECMIRLDGVKGLAFAILGGKWTEAQALAEFRKNPGRFKPQPGADQNLMVTCAKMAA